MNLVQNLSSSMGVSTPFPMATPKSALEIQGCLIKDLIQTLFVPSLAAFLHSLDTFVDSLRN